MMAAPQLDYARHWRLALARRRARFWRGVGYALLFVVSMFACGVVFAHDGRAPSLFEEVVAAFAFALGLVCLLLIAWRPKWPK